MYLLQLWWSFGLSTLSAFVNSASVGTACVFGGQSANLCCICLKRKLLGCWVSVFLTSPASWNSILDSYLTHHHWCSTSPADFEMAVRLHLSHSGTRIWDYTVVLVCVSGMVNHVKQQPMCLFAFGEYLCCPLPSWKIGLWLCFLMPCGRFWIEKSFASHGLSYQIYNKNKVRNHGVYFVLQFTGTACQSKGSHGSCHSHLKPGAGMDRH